MIACGVIRYQNWNEEVLESIAPGRRTTKVSVEYQFTGQIKGRSKVEYLMYYQEYDERRPALSRATYVGLFRFEGEVHGKSGSFVMIDKGVYEQGEAKSDLKILTGSGTHELSSISGLGHCVASRESSLIELHYNLLAARDSRVA